jgi:hypothetical protein
MVLDDSLFFIFSYCNAIVQVKCEESYYNAIYKLINYMDEFEAQQHHQI